MKVRNLNWVIHVLKPENQAYIEKQHLLLSLSGNSIFGVPLYVTF